MKDVEGMEARLLADWRAGDRAAGDELLRHYTPALHAFLGRRTTRNVDDLVQRTLLACVESIGHFEGRSSFKAFLLGIARNQFFMSLRSDSGSISEVSGLMTWPEESPSQLFVAKQEHQLIGDALDKVAPPFRTVLKLYYLDGLSIEEVARTLGISDGTVKSRLSRGRSMMRGMLDSGDDSAEIV
jgi:RNA polymerase sigma-70 factor (ECF subfamily)